MEEVRKINIEFSDRDLRRLIVPLVIEQLLAITVGLFDSVMVSQVGEAAISAVRSGPRTRGNLRSLIGQFVTMRVDEVEHDAGSHHADVQTVENQGIRQRVVHKLRDDAKDMKKELQVRMYIEEEKWSCSTRASSRCSS